MRALVIDDSKAVRTIIKQILSDLRFEVHEAANGREALEKLREIGAVDLAMVDWNMPEMNGIEFVRALRADPVNARICVVMVTTETDMVFVRSAIEAGADEYVMKPFTKEVILEKLDLAGASGR